MNSRNFTKAKKGNSTVNSQIKPLKRRLEKFEDKEDRGKVRRQKEHNEKEGLEKMEIEIKQRIRIEERERDTIRKELAQEKN